MKNREYMSISEFAKISGVSRKALIFYDKIGLFSPACTAENGYRYYSYKQVSLITVINTMAELGIPLKEIREKMSDFSPESAKRLYEQQKILLEQKIEHLQMLRDMADMRLKQIQKGIARRASWQEMVEVVEVKEDIPFFFSRPISSPKSRIPDEVMTEFYDGCEKKGIPFGYTAGFVVDEGDLAMGNVETASHVCFRMSSRAYANGVMPAGTYAVCYGSGDYGMVDHLYVGIWSFIADHGYRIAGNAYEEFLLDQVTTTDSDKYLIQISVKIE